MYVAMEFCLYNKQSCLKALSKSEKVAHVAYLGVVIKPICLLLFVWDHSGPESQFFFLPQLFYLKREQVYKNSSSINRQKKRKQEWNFLLVKFPCFSNFLLFSDFLLFPIFYFFSDFLLFPIYYIFSFPTFSDFLHFFQLPTFSDFLLSYYFFRYHVFSLIPYFFPFTTFLISYIFKYPSFSIFFSYFLLFQISYFF